ncbi:MAG: guanylate kinase [Calditrichota bacterium]
MNKRGRLVVISAPSGAGKSTIIRKIMEQRQDFAYSVSSTTRPPRRFEIDGRDYHFLSHDEFMSRVSAGEFAEWTEVHGELYGTEHSSIQRELDAGKHVLLDIDVVGGEAIRALYPESILIFIDPPSVAVLRERLRQRGTDDEAAIERRLSRYPMEARRGAQYPFHVINDRLETAVQEVLNIIDGQNSQK